MSFFLQATQAPLDYFVSLIDDERAKRSKDDVVGAFEIGQLDRAEATLVADAEAIPGCVFTGTIQGHGSQGFKPPHVSRLENQVAEPGITASSYEYKIACNIPTPVEPQADGAVEG